MNKVERIVELYNEINHLQQNLDNWFKTDINLKNENHVHIIIDIKDDNPIESLIEMISGKRNKPEFIFCTSGLFAKDIISFLVDDMKRKITELQKELDTLVYE